MQRILTLGAMWILATGFCVAQRAGTSKTAAKAAAKLSDAQLEAVIKAKFEKSKIATNHFQVHVQGGVATLEGKTEIVQHKGTATRLAKSAGAVAVNNKIQVSDAARKKASDNLAKGRRRVQVERGEPRSQSAPPKK
jgi:osmotically-inducible protein OsmY